MADEVFKTIFQMDVDNTKLLQGLDDVNKKYVQSTASLDDQKKKLIELQAQEQTLLAARAKSNNVNSTAQYNDALAKTKTAIKDVQAEVIKLSAVHQDASTHVNKFSKDLQNAYDGTKINSLKNDVTGLGKSFTDTGKKLDDSVGSPNAKVETLRKQLRDMRDELGKIGVDGPGFKELSEQAGELETRIKDASSAAAIFGSDSSFTALGNSIKAVGADLLELNFANAASKSQVLVDASKKITFKETVNGVKDLGTTLLNIGKALLTNPIFLIGAAVALIIANFAKLKTAGGLIGTVFVEIGKAIDVVIRAGKDLLDFIGLIDATKKSLEELIALNDDLVKSYENYYKQRISNLNSQNKRVIDLENQQASKLLAINKRQNAQILADLHEYGSSYEDFLEAVRKLQENGAKASDIYTANQVRNNELEIKGQDKLRALHLQIAEEQDKGNQQEIGLQNPENTQASIEKTFKIVQAGLTRQRNEEIRVAKIELKDTDAVGAATSLIYTKYATIRVNAKRKEVADLINSEKTLGLQQIELQKQNLLAANNTSFNKRLQPLVSNEDKPVEQTQLQADAEFQILVEASNKERVLREKIIAEKKEAKMQTITDQKELDAFLIKSDEDISASQLKRDELKKQIDLAELNEEERHLEAMFDANKINETSITELLDNSGSARLRIQIDYAQKELTRLKADNLSSIAEITAAQNKVTELQKQEGEQTKEEKKQETLDILNGIQQITDATFAAFDQQLSAQVAFKDKQLDLQQQQLDQAKSIADKGNAELLQLEQKRLDDLNKEKEKYVRRQQSLIVIELVANSALAIAKAAAQGGIAAPFTIAATIISLIAGLAQAKSVAQQAAFYEGGLFEGQGFTGHGNAHEQSNAVGSKPYQYHKEEFIFNHKTTSKYKDIFQDIHKGNIDLNDWKQKVNAFETVKNNPIIIMNDDQHLTFLTGKMEKLIAAVENQHSSISLDEQGFTARMKNIQSRNDLVKNKLGR